MPSAISPRQSAGIRERLLDWYREARRDLPWRRTRDPYRIWISEIMLQQTRVAAVIPYYKKFLKCFPDIRALARAAEPDLLACWAGLGYYSRARNLQKAARLMTRNGGFPRDYDALRALPGVGAYTAAAIASIAFGEPRAVLDGNVIRVLARLTNDAGDPASAATRRRLQAAADDLLDPGRPGDFNQALMELGATVCLPRDPQCRLCPLVGFCEAKRAGVEKKVPVPRRKPVPVRIEKCLLLVERKGRVLLRQRRGFWELPEEVELPEAEPRGEAGRFRHTITHHFYLFSVRRAGVRRAPAGFRWIPAGGVAEIPLSTVTRKALAAARDIPPPGDAK